MTVIAYKDGILACDSLWVDGDLKSIYKTKIYKLDNGLCIGGAGDSDDRALVKLLSEIKFKGNLTIDHLPTVKQLQEMNQNLTFLIVHRGYKETKIFIINTGDTNCVYEITQKFYAVGSGAHIAIGAMAAGASAEGACKIACTYEINCAEPVNTIKVKR